MPRTHCIRPLTDPATRTRWQALWEVSPQRTAFSSLEYADAVTGVFPIQCEIHLVGDGDHDEAGALIFWKQRGPYRIVVVPPFTPYTTFISDKLPSEAEIHGRTSSLDALLEKLEQRYHRLYFQLHPAWSDVRTFAWRAWRARPFYTYRLQLSGNADPLSRMSDGTRRRLRKAYDAFQISEEADAAPLAAALYAESYARHARRFPAAVDTAATLAGRLVDSGRARVFTARPSGRDEVAGGMVVLHDGRAAHHWIAGSEPGGAMTAMLGHVLPLFRTEGLTTYDFVGANTPTIAEFKRRFGPDLTCYFHVDYITRPELRLISLLK